jgi:MarR family transcriptional regulator for hemolysin
LGAGELSLCLCRIVDRLEVCGLIERHRRPSDRCMRVLRLALAARLKLTEAREIGDMTQNEALSGVSNLDALCLLETLQVLKTNLTVACDAWVPTQRRLDHNA